MNERQVILYMRISFFGKYLDKAPALKALFFMVCAMQVNDAVFAEQAGSVSGNENYKAEFTSFVKRLEYNPDDLEAGNRLREICRKNDKVQDCIEALNELAKKHPTNKAIRYNAALAYIDIVPGHSLFKKGWYSSRSMDHMTDLLEYEPNDWSAYYIRGLNSIYWPKSFKRIPKAVADLKQAIAISESLPEGLRRPYHVLAYIALGDAYVKGGDLQLARETYRQGLALESSKVIKGRMAMTDAELESFVMEHRDTENHVDTDITFLVTGGSNKL